MKMTNFWRGLAQEITVETQNFASLLDATEALAPKSLEAVDAPKAWTHVYDEYGQYYESIPAPSGVSEIHFFSTSYLQDTTPLIPPDPNAVSIGPMGQPISAVPYNSLEEAELRRKSLFFIGENFIKELRKHYKEAKSAGEERGGLLYSEEFGGELKFLSCSTCSFEKDKIDGLTDSRNYEVEQGLSIARDMYVGSWHTHPVARYDWRPSGSYPLSVTGSLDDGDINAFQNAIRGRLGFSYYEIDKDNNLYVGDERAKLTWSISGRLGVIASSKFMTIYRHSGTRLIRVGANSYSSIGEFSHGNYLRAHKDGVPIYETYSYPSLQITRQPQP